MLTLKNGTVYSLKRKINIGFIEDKYLQICPPKGYNHKYLHQYIWMVANQCDIPIDENGRTYHIHHIVAKINI